MLNALTTAFRGSQSQLPLCFEQLCFLKSIASKSPCNAVKGLEVGLDFSSQPSLPFNLQFQLYFFSQLRQSMIIGFLIVGEPGLGTNRSFNGVFICVPIDPGRNLRVRTYSYSFNSTLRETKHRHTSRSSSPHLSPDSSKSPLGRTALLRARPSLSPSLSSMPRRLPPLITDKKTE
jgi:hypothetical protein